MFHPLVDTGVAHNIPHHGGHQDGRRLATRQDKDRRHIEGLDTGDGMFFILHAIVDGTHDVSPVFALCVDCVEPPCSRRVRHDPQAVPPVHPRKTQGQVVEASGGREPEKDLHHGEKWGAYLGGVKIRVIAFVLEAREVLTEAQDAHHVEREPREHALDVELFALLFLDPVAKLVQPYVHDILMMHERLVGESREQQPSDGMMILLVLRDETLAFYLKLRDTEEVEVAHELLRAPADGIPGCARRIGDLVWAYSYNDTILVVQTDEVFVVAASDMLPPETRKPGDGI